MRQQLLVPTQDVDANPVCVDEGGTGAGYVEVFSTRARYLHW